MLTLFIISLQRVVIIVHSPLGEIYLFAMLDWIWHISTFFHLPVWHPAFSLREVVKKKPGYFTVRLTVRVDPPPPPTLTVSCFVTFSEGCT